MAHGERSTNRLLGWLVAVATAGLVAAVLMMMALPGPEPMPPSAMPPLVAARDAAAAASVGITAAANHGERAVAALAAQRDTAAVATRSLWVRIRARCASATHHYTGPLQVDGEPTGPRQLSLGSSEPLPVQFDGVSPLVFTAPGYTPNVCTPPPDADGDRPLDLELQPESALRFRWLHPAALPLDQVQLQLQLQIPATNAFVGQSLSLPLPAETTVALAGGNPVRWRATARAGSRLLQASGVVADLGLAEQREVSVDLSLEAGRRHRLIGPSAALLPHLSVSWQAPDRPVLESLPVDREGGFTLPVSACGPFSVDTNERQIATVASAYGEELRLTLAEPVVGVRLVLDSGAGQPSEVLAPGGNVISRGVAEVHVFPRSQLPPQLRLRVHGEVSTFTTAVLPASADWLELRLADALPALRLSVHVTGPAPVAAARQGMRLVLARDGGATLSEPALADRFKFDLPGPGEWSLRFRCGESLGPVVARAMVAPGAPAELRVDWPLVHEWTGEILGFTELPLPQRWHRVGFGAGESILNGWVLRPDPKGQFRGFRFAAEVPVEPVFVAWGLRRVEAMIETRDDERRHLVVRPSAALRWVEVEWQDGVGTIQVFQVRAGFPPRMVHALSTRQRWPVPVVGDDLVVVLVPPPPSRTPVLSWMSLPAGASRVTIAPMALRRLELRDGSGGSAARTFSPVGPHGVSTGQIEVPAGGSVVVEVPFDTRGLCEWTEDAVEVPVGAGEVVVLP
jgi:hypothetical protein